MVKVKWHKFEYFTDQETGDVYLISDELPDEDQDVLFANKVDGKWDIWTGTYDIDGHYGSPVDTRNGWEIDDSWYWAEFPKPPENENETD